MGREKFIKEATGEGSGPYLVSKETVDLIRRIAGRPVVEMDSKYFSWTERDGVRVYQPKFDSKTESGNRGRGFDRFGVWLDVARQMLMVDLGSILYHTRGGDAVALPVIPKLNGTLLSQKDSNGLGPGISVSGLNAGTTYSVVVYFRAGNCSTNIPSEEEEEAEDDEDINTVQVLSPGELSEEMPHYKGRLIVAELVFKSGSMGKEIQSLTQLFGSDLHVNCSEDDESSSDDESGSGGGSDDEGGGSASSGGGGDPEDPDGSSDDEPAQDECCPGIKYLNGIVERVGLGTADCFNNDWQEEEVIIWVGGYVGPTPLNKEGCKACTSGFDVVYGIGLHQRREKIGVTGKDFGAQFTVSATACSKWQIIARVERFGIPTSSMGCPQLSNCQDQIVVQMPPVCGYDCEESSETETTIIPPP
jgi:hypothetical protein